MKKISKIVTRVSIFCFVAAGLSCIDIYAATYPDSGKTAIFYTSIVAEHMTEYSDVIVWKYKVVDSKMYRRQYNTSKGVWIGEWEPA